MGKPSVILVGARCSGKTQTGLEIARLLGIEFVDADERFVKKHNMSVLEYVNAHGGVPDGWPPFREEETVILEEFRKEYQNRQIVLTPGGGAVAHDQGEKYRQRNVELLRGLGVVFYLSPTGNLEESARILTDRLLNDPRSAGQRPSLTGEQDQYKDMLNTITKRRPLYLEASHVRIYTKEKTIQEVAKDISQLVA